MNMTGLIAAFALTAGQAAFPGPMQSGPGDPRIRYVEYRPDQVVTLPVALGFAAVVALSSDERVESVVVGDSASWQVTANKRGDHVVVKPLAGAAATNMVVITGERRYVFLLELGSAGGGSPFVLRFVPSAAGLAASASQASPVATFRFRGARALFPSAMSDDGRRTLVRWGEGTPLPAIFAVERSGRERLVNGRMVGRDYILEDVAQRFVFRLGKERARADRSLIGTRR